MAQPEDERPVTSPQHPPKEQINKMGLGQKASPQPIHPLVAHQAPPVLSYHQKQNLNLCWVAYMAYYQVEFQAQCYLIHALDRVNLCDQGRT